MTISRLASAALACCFFWQTQVHAAPSFAGRISVLATEQQQNPQLAALRSTLQVVVSAPGGYTGPGDVVASAKAFWGFRCYNTAYTGNVADVYAPADASHTLLTCSSGGTINETIQSLATTCTVSCTVQTLYDQSGASSCGGACDVTQATISNRPSLIRNCQNSKSCLQYVESATTGLCNATGFATAQPYSWSMVAERTVFTGNGSHPLLFGTGAAIVSTFFRGAANQIGMSGGGTLGFTANDNVIHSVQEVFNNTTSSGTVDGTTTSGTTGVFNLTTPTICIGGGGVAGADTWRGMEIGVWAGGFSGGNITAMTNNQRSATDGWNF